MALIGKTNEEKIWNYLKNKGLNNYAISGVMGNMFAESGLSPINMQDSYEKKLGYNDITYTNAVDNGSYTNFVNDAVGYGITQTTYWSRKQSLYNFAKSYNVSIGDLEMQLDFFWKELTEDFSLVYKALKTVQTVKQASDLILTKFEMPGDMSDSMKNLRASYSQKYYNNYANKGSDTMPTSNTVICNVINDAVNFAVSIANDNTHGYSQAIRSLYNITNPTSFDCSSLVCTSYYYAFVKNGLIKQAEYIKDNCSYTGNMLKLLNCGFEVVATKQTAHAQMKKGDIELNTTYHTAMAIEKDNIVHARSSEGTNNTTDDSGNEIRVQPWYLYSHGWTHRLRFTGKGINLTQVASPNTSVTVSSSSNSCTLLRKGSTGQGVKELQEKLNKLGYGLVVDGDFGNKTQTAVLDFQRKSNIEIDGIVGPTTLSFLNTAISKISLGNSSPNEKKPYLVKITASELNIRSTPDATNNRTDNIVGTIKDQGVYTIVDEQNGWGKLKSGVGWISLEYTQKL